MATDMNGSGPVRTPRLVIFDFDGGIALEQLAAEMGARGAPVSYHEARSRFLGVSTATHMAFISEISGQPRTPDFPEPWQALSRCRMMT
jgi:hypothetical protein